MKHEELVAELGEILTNVLKKKVDIKAKAFYDHGDKRLSNVCQPAPYFLKYSEATILANLDLAVVLRDSREIILCEVEQEGSNPKRLIGDIVSLFLAEGIRVKDEDYWLEDFDHVHLIVGIIAKKRESSEDKAKELQKRIEAIIKSKSLEKMEIQFISGTDYGQLIGNLQRTLLAMLGVIG